MLTQTQRHVDIESKTDLECTVDRQRNRQVPRVPDVH